MPIVERQYTVGKVFTFDAAHQLPLHDGKCRNLHGHTYRVQVSVTGPLETEGPKTGMVIDFGDLADVWEEHIEPLVDHKFLNETLPVACTTAEYIAAWMRQVLCEHLPIPYDTRSPWVTVTVWETPNSWARAS